MAEAIPPNAEGAFWMEDGARPQSYRWSHSTRRRFAPCLLMAFGRPETANITRMRVELALSLAKGLRLRREA